MTSDGVTLPPLPETVRAVRDGLTTVPGMRALRLGGSRAIGRPTRPDSDWDLLAYVDELPSADDLRVSLPGPLGSDFEFDTANAGHPLREAELRLPTSPRIDVCFRPLGRVEQERRRVSGGAFTLHALPKFPIGVPSYVLLTELALSVDLHGELAVAPCPAGFVAVAAPWWRGRAACGLLLAIDHLVAGEPVDALGHVLAAATALAHARLLELGHWYPITKRLLNEPGALAPPLRRSLPRLSAARLTTDAVRGITEDMELDEQTGLDWLSAGEFLGPGTHTPAPAGCEIGTRS